MENLRPLEDNLLPVGDWVKAPAQAQEVAMDLARDYGGNVGMGRTKKLGWYVLHQQLGEGSTALVWKEKNGTKSKR